MHSWADAGATNNATASSACARRTSNGLPPAAPPGVDELVHHLHQLSDGSAFLDDVACGRVERHDAVADAPTPLPLWVQPDDALDTLPDLPDRPRLRVVVVVARVAEDEHRRLAVQRLDLRSDEATEGVAEVRAAVVVHGGGLQRPLDRVVHRVRVEGLSHLGDLGHEDVGAHPREAFLEAPDELEHEPRS